MDWSNYSSLFVSLSAASSSPKKHVSVSQHSSTIQADDSNSPYPRVRSPAHADDKVRPAEHSSAQFSMSVLNVVNGGLGNVSASQDNTDSSLIEKGLLSRRGPHQSLLDPVDGHQQEVINDFDPAASHGDHSNYQAHTNE